jgi:4-oxalocrotonate tautomerase
VEHTDMPFAIVEFSEPRTIDQKRHLVRAITDAMVTCAGCKPEHLHVVIHESTGNADAAAPASTAPASAPARRAERPVVIVEFWVGRTAEQKRDLVAAITAAMVSHGGCEAERVRVLIHDASKENWGRGGVLCADMAEK